MIRKTLIVSHNFEYRVQQEISLVMCVSFTQYPNYSSWTTVVELLIIDRNLQYSEGAGSFEFVAVLLVDKVQSKGIRHKYQS